MAVTLKVERRAIRPRSIRKQLRVEGRVPVSFMVTMLKTHLYRLMQWHYQKQSAKMVLTLFIT